MTHQDLYKLLTMVQKNVRCPQCGKPYDLSLIQIRGIVESVIFLELACINHMPLLATVTMTQTMSKPIGHPDKNRVNSDDVIEMYRFLENFHGSFKKLFDDKKTNTKKKEIK